MRVGKWLDTKCTTVQEDRLLTHVLVPFIVDDGRDGGCLGGIAFGYTGQDNWFLPGRWFLDDTAERFNRLCQQLIGRKRNSQKPYALLTKENPALCYLGGQRAAVLIRNRILANRLKRTLKEIPGRLHYAVR